VVCRRERAHSQEDIACFINNTISRYEQVVKTSNQLEEVIKQAAVEALVREALLTPKPGLVDGRGSGSHSDMTLDLFIKSAFTIVPFVGSAFREGFSAGLFRIDDARLLARLKELGLSAEQSMFSATNGVNTHKGAVFSLLLVAGAVGRLVGLGKLVVSESPYADSFDGRLQKKAMDNEPVESKSVFPVAQLICTTAAHIVEGLTERELKGLRSLVEKAGDKAWDEAGERTLTHGELNYIQHGRPGIRGEAENGFPSVLNHGLQALAEQFDPFEPNAFGTQIKLSGRRTIAELKCLLALMTVLDDGNILYRGNLQHQKKIKDLSMRALEEMRRDVNLLPDEVLKLPGFNELDKYCSEYNLSPGGSADMLILSIFLYELESRLYRE
jgi:triphosphoribosyl-dephospho-CoA synthetase